MQAEAIDFEAFEKEAESLTTEKGVYKDRDVLNRTIRMSTTKAIEIALRQIQNPKVTLSERGAIELSKNLSYVVCGHIGYEFSPNRIDDIETKGMITREEIMRYIVEVTNKVSDLLSEKFMVEKKFVCFYEKHPSGANLHQMQFDNGAYFNKDVDKPLEGFEEIKVG